MANVSVFTGCAWVIVTVAFDKVVRVFRCFEGR